MPPIPTEIPTDHGPLSAILLPSPTPTGALLLDLPASPTTPRDLRIALHLHHFGFTLLLLDPFTADDEFAHRKHLSRLIDLHARRLAVALRWLSSAPATRHLRLGCFASHFAAAPALVAAAALPDVVAAVVSCAGRPDLAGAALPQVCAPTLFLLGAADAALVPPHRFAMSELRTEAELALLPGHLDDPARAGEVARRAADWLARHLEPRRALPHDAPR